MDKLQSAIDDWFKFRNATDLTYMASFAPDGFGFEKGGDMRFSLFLAIRSALEETPAPNVCPCGAGEHACPGIDGKPACAH